MTSDEEWRPVVGWDGLYEVSSLGRVRSVTRTVSVSQRARAQEEWRTFRGKMLRQTAHCAGYTKVSLCRDGKPKKEFVHVLVCEAFHGPKPDGHEVAHGDGDRRNARAGNLRWVTRSGNMLDAQKHGTFSAGEQSGTAKLTVSQVREIRANTAARGKDLAEQYGVARSTISNIRKRHSWNVPGYF